MAVLNGGGDHISRVSTIESGKRNHAIIGEITETLQQHPAFELLWLKHEPMLSFPGSEKDPPHRKV